MATDKTAGGQPGLRRLVIVESPAKAKTIAGYLGPGLRRRVQLRAHPRPAEPPPRSRGGEQGPLREVRRRRQRRLRAALRRRRRQEEEGHRAQARAQAGADELYLATDEDREGEAIAWHLLQVLEPKVPVRRMVFHEITRDAIREAVEQTRGARPEPRRRAGDPPHPRPPLRLRGLARSCGRRSCQGLSAGRVQSVATRLVVERERERIAFRTAVVLGPRGDVRSSPRPTSAPFDARLVQVDGRARRHRARLRQRRPPGRALRRRPPRRGRGARASPPRCRASTFTVRIGRGQAVHPQARPRRS